MAPVLNDLCRLCGTDTLSVVRHLIFASDGPEVHLAEKIAECLPITVTEADRLPKIVCGECAYKLDLLSEFRGKVLQTEQFLENIANTTETVKEEAVESDLDAGDDSGPFSPEQDDSSLPMKEEPSPAKRPRRAAAKRTAAWEPSESEEASEDEEEKPETKPLPKKRGRKPKEKECRQCGERVLDAAAHMAEQHPERLACAKCGEACASAAALREHRRLQHSAGAESGVCEACGVFAKDLRRHTITKHTRDFPFACAECPKRFVSRSELNAHGRSSHGSQRKEMSLLCKYCGRSFSRKQYLVDHERKHRDERPFECATCGNTYYSKVLLKSHQRVHASAGYSYECDLCHMKFTTQTGCKAHRKRHFAENRRFECLACGERFFKRATLDAHQISKHTHVKPYECAMCSKRFPAKYDLQKHVETHIRVKSQVCEFCGAAYFRPDHLRRHKMQQHRELVPAYRCDLCDRLYTEERVLFNHKLRYHKLGDVPASHQLAAS